MVIWLCRKVGVISFLPRGFFQNSASKQATTGQPIGCPNSPTRSPVFLQDIVDRKTIDLDGDLRLRKGEW